MRYLYSESYRKSQLRKFYNRHDNHFRNHILLAKRLVAEHDTNPSSTLLDLGCSIGTLALEFALDGYNTIGLDFDAKALVQAKKLAKELGCNPKWVCGDAGTFRLREKVDIVVCFDLFEHLSDDVIKNTLNCIRENLKTGGVLVFHTFPTLYNHVFYNGALTCLPLIPFRNLPEKRFEILVRWYTNFLDLFYILRYGRTHKRVIARTVHPNPLAKKGLQNFLRDAGFDVVLLETTLDSINPLKLHQGRLAKKYFSNQPVAHRSIWGVAIN
jgi:SAM-dependent methyltransferase